MSWNVEYHPDFVKELKKAPRAFATKLLFNAGLLEAIGPQLSRPYCDTLSGSQFQNMKELRITIPGGEWRVAFAFDPERSAILLAGGSKSGVSEKQFYKELIHMADMRFKFLKIAEGMTIEEHTEFIDRFIREAAAKYGDHHVIRQIAQRSEMALAADLNYAAKVRRGGPGNKLG